MDIFVGSIPFKLKEIDLREIFEEYGDVSSVKIVINKLTRQNKGFGFVVMPNEEEALVAIKALDGTEVQGRIIEVSKSEPKKEEDKKKNFRIGQNQWENKPKPSDFKKFKDKRNKK